MVWLLLAVRFAVRSIKRLAHAAGALHRPMRMMGVAELSEVGDADPYSVQATPSRFREPRFEIFLGKPDFGGNPILT